MRILPAPPGVKLRRTQMGQRVRLFQLVNNERGEVRWAVVPTVLVVGRVTRDEVLLHEEEAWSRCRAAHAAVPLFAMRDRDWPCEPVRD